MDLSIDKRSDYRMLDERECFERYDSLIIFHQPPWRNRLARSAVNRKVGGSSPPGGAYLSASLGKFHAICNGRGPTFDNLARWSRGMILA